MSTYERLVNSQIFFSPYLTQEDLSRLGRNYLKTGELIEIVFPEYEVRYIAINDGVDTAREDNEFTPLRNWFKNKLQKGFRLTEGKSVAEYVRTLRMERALDLLEDDTLSIQDVAEKVGYNGISNFYAVFRQTFGDTPAAIQKLLETC